MSAQVSSPATSPSPIAQPSFVEGQEVAFIYNRTDLISGIITALNPDDTFDLECNVPVRVRQVDFIQGVPKITFKTILETRPFLKATPVDPRMQVIKRTTTLREMGMDDIIIDEERGAKQTSISMWRDSGRKVRVPRLTEFYAPLVGHFFDSRLFYYRIVCWRAAINLRGQGAIPEVTEIFPKKKPFFTSFSKCFSRFVKEYHSNLEKWNRVEMQAILPQDVATAEKGDSNA